MSAAQTLVTHDQKILSSNPRRHSSKNTSPSTFSGVHSQCTSVKHRARDLKGDEEPGPVRRHDLDVLRALQQHVGQENQCIAGKALSFRLAPYT
jgi:hypothetical protein